MRRLLPLLPLLLLAACGPRDTDPGPGGVTVGEARALDRAAEMLERQQTLPPGAVERTAPSPQPSQAARPSPAPPG
jgi:hypothetical protein